MYRLTNSRHLAMGNKYRTLLDGGNIFTINDGSHVSLCTQTATGGIVVLKKNFKNTMEAINFAYNRAKKKKRFKNIRPKRCVNCGVTSRYVKLRDVFFYYDKIHLCDECYGNKINK